MRKIFPGDTVKITAAVYSSLDRVPKPTRLIFEETKTPIPVEGAKFLVSHNMEGMLYTQFINHLGSKDRCAMGMEWQVTLLKRPLKNWIKLLLNKMN